MHYVFEILDQNSDLNLGETYIYVTKIFKHQSQLEYLYSLLSKDEIRRALRFHFHRDFHAYCICRGLLRMLVGYFLSTDPQVIQFEYSEFGKPLVSDLSLQFNISHSMGIVAFAITLHDSVGIDIEFVRPLADLDQLAYRSFSRIEYKYLHQHPASERLKIFFQIWTRKESLIKADGQGLHIPLQSFSTLATTGQNSVVFLANPNPSRSMEYCIQDVEISDNFKAALTVNRQLNKFRIVEF